jgi:magnesium chelatase subunit D
VTVFPLAAIVGQEALVEALLVNAVAPDVGGVLVRGERGTAKSTAVRALAPLLPQPAPFVEVPLGATLDRLVGALDFGRALGGEHAVERGLLARADGGILYVDEVNLLPDHLVDALLDAAASGVVRVERDAVSVEHDARFVLVGTMNAEEGELRPQLLDRFGLGVEVSAPADRAEVVRRRLAFDGDPGGFVAGYSAVEAELRDRILSARALLPSVVLPERELRRIVDVCAALGVDGVRGDITCARAARALAALRGADEVIEDDVRSAARLALAHRRRSDPLGGSPSGPDDIDRAFDDPPPEGGGRPSGRTTPTPATTPAPERLDTPVAAQLPLNALRLDGRGHGPTGRRSKATGPDTEAIDSRPGDDDLALVATLRARLLGDNTPRQQVRAGREGALLCLVVDASGSMGARKQLARVKGALLEVLRDAYARRDRVAIVAFRDEAAETLVAPGAPLEQAAAAIRELPTGGRTPLAAGLAAATELVARERDRRTIAVVLTDGRVADPDGAVHAAAQRLGAAADALHVVDTEEGAVRLGLAATLAAAGGGHVHTLRSAA